jgi:hypothetical protein
VEPGGLEFVPAVVDADPPAVASRGDLRLKAETAAPIEVEIGDVTIRIGRGGCRDARDGAASAEGRRVIGPSGGGPPDGCDAAG